MRALRFGSYSMAATLAGIPSLFRRKSTIRYCCLWPPPRWRAVLRPWLLRPPVPDLVTTSVRSGRSFVISLESDELWKRRPGLVGLRLRSAIVSSSAFEELDAVVAHEADDRALGVRALAVGLG